MDISNEKIEGKSLELMDMDLTENNHFVANNPNLNFNSIRNQNPNTQVFLPHRDHEFKEREKEKEYIKIPTHYIIYFPIILVIICLILFVSTAYSQRKSHKLIKASSVDLFNRAAAGIILDLIKENKRARIGLDYGYTAKGVYKYLVDRYLINRDEEKNGEISFRHVRLFNLEEICGKDYFDTESYAYFLRDNFINLVDIKLKNVFLIKGTGDLEKNVNEYNEILNEKPVDLQIISIEKEGTFGFIKPFESFEKRTHIVNFSRQKRKEIAEDRFDNQLADAPTQGITQGIKNLLEAKSLLFLAKGKEAAYGLKILLKGKINPDVPLSAFNNYKGTIYIVADEEAYSTL